MAGVRAGGNEHDNTHRGVSQCVYVNRRRVIAEIDERSYIIGLNGMYVRVYHHAKACVRRLSSITHVLYA